MNSEQNPQAPQAKTDENKDLRKKSVEEKKEEKDALIHLWMQDMGQAEKPKN